MKVRSSFPFADKFIVFIHGEFGDSERLKELVDKELQEKYFRVVNEVLVFDVNKDCRSFSVGAPR